MLLISEFDGAEGAKQAPKLVVKGFLLHAEGYQLTRSNPARQA